MRGGNVHGRWGNGHPRESVVRQGFTPNWTGTTPQAYAPPPDKAPTLLLLSEPWYETPSRVNWIRLNPLRRSQTGGATVDRYDD